MALKGSHRLVHLEKELLYMLSRAPEEFVLIPDQEGYFSLKEVMKALREEGLDVSEKDLRELLLQGCDSIDLEGNKIRAKQVYYTLEYVDGSALKGQLFTAIRRRAHVWVFEDGIKAAPDHPWPVSYRRDLVERWGKRKDSQAVILHIDGAKLNLKGKRVLRMNDIFLLEEIPKEAFVGPFPSSEMREAVEEKKREQVQRLARQRAVELPGSVFMRPLDEMRQRREKGRKPKGWKEQSRKLRRT